MDQQTIADYPVGGAASTPTYRYVVASYIDEPVVRKGAGTGGTIHYYHRNQQYSVTAITNAAAALAERYAYTAYGLPTILNASATIIATSAISNRYTYTGREWDATLALHHFRARWMSPVAGRFLSRDPIEFEGSQWNLYETLASVPMLNVDPLGLKCNRRKYSLKPDFPFFKMNFLESSWSKILSGVLPFEYYSSLSTEIHSTIEECDVECCEEKLTKIDSQFRLKLAFGFKIGAILPIAGVPVMFAGSFEVNGMFKGHVIDISGGCQKRSGSLCISGEAGVEGKVCAMPPGRLWQKLVSFCLKASGNCKGGGCMPVGQPDWSQDVPNLFDCEAKISMEACGFFMCAERDLVVCNLDGCRIVNPLASWL
jgi:RHS repeat-associated protein